MIRRTIAVLAVVCAFATRLAAQCPTAAATAQSPSGNLSNPNSPVTFSWVSSTASGVSGYDVLVGQGTASRTVVCSAASTANTCTFAAGFPAGGYNWLVRTKFTTTCPGIDSAIKSFTVNCPTAVPVNQSPSDGATNVSTSPTLQWNAVSGASGYEVFFGPSGAAGAGCNGQPITTVTTNTATAPQLQAGTSYEWKVEAIFANGCPGTLSACTKFTTTVASCNPTGAFSLVSPANGSTVTTDKPTLQWSASTGADKYFVHVGLQNPPVPQASDPQVSASNTSYTINTSLPSATYYWYVDAVPTCGTAGKTASSTVSHFTVSTCPTAATTLTSPANGATNVPSPVTFKWTGVNGASGYNLYIAGELVTTTSDVQATVPLASGSSLSWYVDTLYKNCNAVRSLPSSFQTSNPAACPTGTIIPAAPASGATLSGDSKVTFSWSSVNATAYRLFVSVDGGPFAQYARTTDPTATVPVPSGSIDWYVEALFTSTTLTNCPSIVSSHSKFTVTPSTSCSAHKAVTLVAPISGSAASPVTFSWTATDPFVTLYTVWISVNGAPFDDIGVTTSTQLKSSVDAGTIVWYVQSFFEGCPAVSSPPATFTATSTTPRCPTAVSTTLAPVNNITVLSPVTFTWTPVTGVDDYRLFVSKDGGEFEALDDDLDDTTATHNLPPGVYLWYVESTFDECPSTRSTRSKFTVNQAQNCPTAGPALLSPPDALQTVANPVTFDWSDAPNATAYSLVARHNDGSPTRLALTTVSNATRHLAPGSYEWWVIAFFPGCPSTESAHRTFVIPPDTCDFHGPLLLHLPPTGISIVSPVRFAWSNVRNASQYKVWASVDGGPFSVIGRATTNTLTTAVPPGAVNWYVEAVPPLTSCTSVLSPENGFTSLSAPPQCDKPARPQATAIGQVASGTPYSVRWAAVLNTDHYEVQESTTSDFNNATTQNVSDTSADFNHIATTAPVHYYYRVRAVSSCDDQHSLYSKVVSVFVVPAQKQTSVEYGIATKATQTVKLPGQTPATTFSVIADQPWVTVTPSSGNIGPSGVTLTVTSDPGSLDLGTNTATLIVTYGVSGKTAPNAVSGGSIPVSINLVTPVAPNGKNTPLPTSLIIPAVAHAQGANSSLFQSDVRIANVSATAQKYQLNFTLSGTDGTLSGQSTIIQIDPGTQMSLNDILTTFFGAGNDGNGSAGVLEIRPLTNNSSGSSFSSGSTVSVQTVASSKTYNVTSNGTFGQFIPAIPFSQFISNTGSGAAQSFISLQQIAQSAAFRTNLGILEAAGEPASVLVHVYDNAGNQLAQIPVTLLPGQHTQINSFLAVNNLNVTDGRIEVEVTSTTGKVSAYASVVDNQTNDPLLVFPVLKGAATATRYTIPGVADLNNGFASWRSDIRVFNPSASAASATLTYYPQGGATVPTPQTVTIAPGQVYAIDNALQTLYGLTNSGGAIVVSTPSTSALTVTARTYNQTGSGTYGQFIPAVSPAQSVGLGDRTLQVLQLESSSAYRTNIGLVETSGNPVTVQVTVLPADSKVSANLSFDLNPNEFRQFSIGDFGFGTMYNTRVSVKVTAGSGKVTAYGSVIDQITQDPTYVPAQ